MGLGIPKDDQPFIRDGNICKGIEILCCIVLQYLTAECLIQNTIIEMHQCRCAKHFLGYSGPTDSPIYPRKSKMVNA